METFHAIMGNPITWQGAAWFTIVCILSVMCVSLQQIIGLLKKIIGEEEDEV